MIRIKYFNFSIQRRPSLLSPAVVDALQTYPAAGYSEWYSETGSQLGSFAKIVCACKCLTYMAFYGVSVIDAKIMLYNKQSQNLGGMLQWSFLADVGEC